MTAEIGTLAALIERLGAGVDRFDEAFARGLAGRLGEAADRLELVAIERLGIVDVLVNFTMDRTMRLVVTGRLPDGPGEITVSWREDEFPDVAIALLATPRADPYIFCTLDLSVRGRRGVLTRPVARLPAGLEVRVRALATIGRREEYRVEAHGVSVSVPPDGIELV